MTTLQCGMTPILYLSDWTWMQYTAVPCIGIAAVPTMDILTAPRLINAFGPMQNEWLWSKMMTAARRIRLG